MKRFLIQNGQAKLLEDLIATITSGDWRKLDLAISQIPDTTNISESDLLRVLDALPLIIERHPAPFTGRIGKFSF